MNGSMLLFLVLFDAALGFLVWRALATGKLPTFGAHGDFIRRSSNPSMFWSGWIILVLMMVLATLVPALLYMAS